MNFTTVAPLLSLLNEAIYFLGRRPLDWFRFTAVACVNENDRDK